jgi:hypothetical protein
MVGCESEPSIMAIIVGMAVKIRFVQSGEIARHALTVAFVVLELDLTAPISGFHFNTFDDDPSPETQLNELSPSDAFMFSLRNTRKKAVLTKYLFLRSNRFHTKWSLDHAGVRWIIILFPDSSGRCGKGVQGKQGNGTLILANVSREIRQ